MELTKRQKADAIELGLKNCVISAETVPFIENLNSRIDLL